jgi:hypothetical protein
MKTLTLVGPRSWITDGFTTLNTRSHWRELSPWSRVCRGEAAAAALAVVDPWAGAEGAREGAAAARLREPWGMRDPWWGRCVGGESVRIGRLRDSRAYWTVEIVGRQNKAETAYPLEP